MTKASLKACLKIQSLFLAAIWMDITSEVQQGLPKSVLVQYGGQGCLNHPILGERLRAVTKALLTHTDMDVVDILGEVDASSKIGRAHV